MWKIAEKFSIRLGGNYFIDHEPLMVSQGRPLFSVIRREDGVIGINCLIYDQGGKQIASVHRGKVMATNDDYEDLNQPDWYRLVERKTGRLLCEIKRGAKADQEPQKSLIYPDGPPKHFLAVQMRDALARDRPVELSVSVDLYSPSGFRVIAGPDMTNLENGATYVGNTNHTIVVP